MKLSTFIFKLKRKINNYYMKIFFKLNFKDICNFEINDNYNLIYDFEYFKKNFFYEDDNWLLIKKLSDYLEHIFQKKNFLYDKSDYVEKKYILTKDSIFINSTAHINNWICLFLDLPQVTNYCVEYDVIPYCSLSEIQLAFNYIDLGNRLRFMIHDDKEVVFESVYRGLFYHKIRKKDYIVQKNKKLKIKLIVKNNIYFYYINDVLIYSILDKNKLINNNKICLIFYNKNDNDDVKLEITDFKLSVIE